MDVTPDAIVSEVFVEVLPEILKTKAADTVGEKNINPGKNQILQNSHSTTLKRTGLNWSIKQGDVPKRKSKATSMRRST